MARKAVLHGGKRDEIIDTAMQIFFEKGYEGTSVRTIMEAAGGEIGMFYHYFPSKEKLFDEVIEHFFASYQERFQEMIEKAEGPEAFVKAFLPLYETAMKQFESLQAKMHWTIQYAMHERTVSLLVPHVEKAIAGWPETEKPDILAAELVYGISGLIHTPAFQTMDPQTRKDELLSFLHKVIGR